MGRRGAKFGKIHDSLYEHWNGTAWSVVAGPNEGILNAVLDFSPANAWAFADFNTLHWNGKKWSVVSSSSSGRRHRRRGDGLAGHRRAHPPPQGSGRRPRRGRPPLMRAMVAARRGDYPADRAVAQLGGHAAPARHRHGHLAARPSGPPAPGPARRTGPFATGMALALSPGFRASSRPSLAIPSEDRQARRPDSKL